MSHRSSLSRVHREMLGKYRLPPQTVKQILQKANIGATISKQGNVHITQSDLRLYHQQSLAIVEWMLYIIHFLLIQGEHEISLSLLTRTQQRISVTISQYGDIYVRSLYLKVFSDVPSEGYGEGESSEPFFLEKEFRIFGDSSMAKPSYAFLHLLESLFSRYTLDVVHMRDGVIHRFLRRNRLETAIWKEVQLRKPSVKKIRSYRMSPNEQRFLDVITFLFPFSKISFPFITLRQLLDSFPILPQEIQDE